MRALPYLTLLALCGLAVGCRPAPTIAISPTVGEDKGPAEKSGFEVTGKTRPVPGRVAIIAPTVLHPVEEVKVVPGDRVKKGQVLIKIDDDEAQADVRAKKAVLAEMKAGLARLKAQPREDERAELRAALESAEVSAQDAREVLKRLTSAYESGSLPQATYQTAKTSLRKTRAEERVASARLRQALKRPIALEVAELEAKIGAAQAILESAQAEVEHYAVQAPMDGVISWLDVVPGIVSRPGTTVWGEVLDLREIDVQCDLTPEQADEVALSQTAQVIGGGRHKGPGEARVVFVGVAADKKTGRVPVRVRLKNPGERLRCFVEVKVRFAPGGGARTEARKPGAGASPD